MAVLRTSKNNFHLKQLLMEGGHLNEYQSDKIFCEKIARPEFSHF
jgi:hypothetical protein